MVHPGLLCRCSTSDYFVLGKRKAPPTSESAPKKQKLDDGSAQATATPTGEEPTKTLFVGRLSWNVDNDRLAQEFSEIGEVESARVQMDRNTGKSRGFGYVNFVDAASVDKALETMQGAEIDGRPVNLDRSSQVSKEAGREKRANAFGDNEASGPPTSTLFVGNLSWDSTEDTVWETFGEHGVKGVRLPTDRETGRPKGFGYVEFENVDGAKAAYETLKGTEIDGRAIRMDYRFVSFVEACACADEIFQTANPVMILHLAEEAVVALAIAVADVVATVVGSVVVVVIAVDVDVVAEIVDSVDVVVTAAVAGEAVVRPAVELAMVA